MSHMAATEGQPLTFGTLPIVEEPPAPPEIPVTGRPRSPIADQITSVPLPSPLGEPSGAVKEETVDVTALLYAIPELAALGPIFRSSSPVPLTESETEYIVQCVKHVFEDHLVLDFSIHNTIEDQKLTDVTVALDSDAGNEMYTLVGK